MASRIKTAVQNLDNDLYKLDGREVTRQQLEMLQAMSPELQWIVVHFQEPEDYKETIKQFSNDGFNEG